MPALRDDFTEGSSSQPAHNESSSIALVAATACLVWYSAVVLVCIIGCSQLWRHFSNPRSESEWSPSNAPDVTVIRPIKGLEPSLYNCLASTFRQTYPKLKLHIRFCISDRDDPALPVLERLLRDFPDFDAQILVEDEDEVLKTNDLGPNPKIRNMSRAYREAVGDVVWIIDCNVWVARGVCGRMVARLEGRGEQHRNKFVHLLPLVVDTEGTTLQEETQGLLSGEASSSNGDIYRTTSTSGQGVDSRDRNIWNMGGGRLEELFMSSSHAKFYTAINTVLIAPCIVGKSTMFRWSHLNTLTHEKGIDTFGNNICEDHLIGDLLWKSQVPEEKRGERMGKHAMCFGDLAVQPMSNMGVLEYAQRRVRWLRVRKFTVTLATLVEPGTESFLCSLYGAFAVTKLPFFNNSLYIPQTWTSFAVFWISSVVAWCLVDWNLYRKLHSAASIDIDRETPGFARPPKGRTRRPFAEWFLAWLGREALAFPVWFWAVWGGTKVQWRGKRFWVGMDMKVHEITDDDNRRGAGPERVGNGHLTPERPKARVD
ncbi:glycosyltransferase family 21 protein [Polychaeton citri CBS 116435]|uniref:Ceramide glucosyltransferase n=1 Tax=Polychaeton citri CBS 116435 TaxID=1314669 RepID=A0A9P4Q7R8_9PEZI|nr:glycosyltransferase family 21 protein [Polychaeton citri CBS 116435]